MMREETEDKREILDNLPRLSAPRGEGRPRAKLSDRDIPEILALLASGVSSNRIAKMKGVAAKTITQIRDGKTWTHVK